MQFNLGESAMSLANFAPFAGFMLRGYERQRPLERPGEEIHEALEDMRAGDTIGTKLPLGQQVWGDDLR
jgi:hypothetical protein